MAAIAARFDVTAERGGAATLDRDHGAPPRRGQRRAMLIAERRTEVAEHVRQGFPLAGHGTRPSGEREVQYGWRIDVERFQRTGRGADLAGGDHQIPGRRAQIAMTEQHLNGGQVCAGLKQVNGKRSDAGSAALLICRCRTAPVLLPTGACDRWWME